MLHRKITNERSQPKEPRVTVTKGIRLTGDELTHVRNLLSQYPECASEAELLRQATLLGVYVLAAQATGHPVHGGYQPSELVALLKYRVLPAIDFLFAHDAYPALYRTREIAVVEPLTSEATGSDTVSTEIIPNAAAFLGEIGTGFMDD